MFAYSVWFCWPWVYSVFQEVTLVKLPLIVCNVVGYFQITSGLFYKVSPGAHPLIRKFFFLHPSEK